MWKVENTISWILLWFALVFILSIYVPQYSYPFHSWDDNGQCKIMRFGHGTIASLDGKDCQELKQKLTELEIFTK